MAKKNNAEVIFKALMHCEGCATKVHDCLVDFGGVENVSIDIETDMVMAKGCNLDPLKLLARLQKKYSKNVELISPIPKPQPPIQEKKETPKPEEPKIKTLVLKVLMHCEGCAHDVEKTVGRIRGVVSVEADMNSSTVVVVGFFDPSSFVENVRKLLGSNKHVELVKQQQNVEAGRGKNKDQQPKREKELQQFEYICYCTPPVPFRPNVTVHPCPIFSDENVFACTIM